MASAQSTYDQLKTSIAYQKATLESDIAARQADSRSAGQTGRAEAAAVQQEIQQADAGVNEARAQMELPASDWERSQTLYKNDDISKQQYDQARTKFETANAVLAQAEERAMVQEGPRKEDIAGGPRRVARAQAAVQTAEANRMDLRREQENWSRAGPRSTAPEAQAGIAEAQLDDTDHHAVPSTAWCW